MGQVWVAGAHGLSCSRGSTPLISRPATLPRAPCCPSHPRPALGQPTSPPAPPSKAYSHSLSHPRSRSPRPPPPTTTNPPHSLITPPACTTCVLQPAVGEPIVLRSRINGTWFTENACVWGQRINATTGAGEAPSRAPPVCMDAGRVGATTGALQRGGGARRTGGRGNWGAKRSHGCAGVRIAWTESDPPSPGLACPCSFRNAQAQTCTPSSTTASACPRPSPSRRAPSPRTAAPGSSGSQSPRAAAPPCAPRSGWQRCKRPAAGRCAGWGLDSQSCWSVSTAVGFMWCGVGAARGAGWLLPVDALCLQDGVCLHSNRPLWLPRRVQQSVRHAAVCTEAVCTDG